MRGGVAITAAFVAIGCSIGALEGFSGGDGAPDASALDGTPAGDVGPTNDATPTNDGATNDAGTDGAIDAAAALDCDAGGYLICSTFDQGAVALGWGGTKLESGGTVGTSNDHRSAPYSMRTQLPAMTADANQYAGLYALWSGVRALRIAFDLKIATPQWGTSDEAVALLHVLYPSSTNETYLFRAPAETTLSIEQNDVTTRYQQVQALPYDKWLRVTLEVVPTAPKGSIRLLYDGLVVYENANVGFGTPSVPETYVDLGLARFTPPSPALDVLYDNVTIEQIP